MFKEDTIKEVVREHIYGSFLEASLYGIRFGDNRGLDLVNATIANEELESVKKEADEFYERIKDKPKKVLERYATFLKPHLNKEPKDCFMWYAFNERMIKYAAIYRKLVEDDVKEKLTES